MILTPTDYGWQPYGDGRMLRDHTPGVCRGFCCREFLEKEEE